VEPATQGGWAAACPAQIMRAMETRIMRRLRHKRRRAFIESYEFPHALQVKLRRELGDDRQASVALDGLREWYVACLSAPGEMLGMPSRAVDVAWHEMILMTRAYHHFCARAFGHYLHHTPDSVMEGSMHESLARTLNVLEGRSLTLAGVPLLFAIDGELGIEDGQVWSTQEIDHLRQVDLNRHASHYYGGGSGAGCAAGSGCSSGSSCGGGGCGGGGCGGGG
jgi:hypothetical protein